MRAVISTLGSPQLRRILAAYTVNRLGTWIGVIALSLAVFDHTHSALAVAATLIAAQVLPAFLVPMVVAKVEASRRRRELPALYLLEGVATAAIAVMLSHFLLPVILLLVALDGTAALAASALLRTELARVARERPGAQPAGAVATAPEDNRGEEEHEAEQRANAALNVAFSITFVLGPILGGALAGGAGAAAALYIDSATFLVCGLLLLDLHPHVEEAADTPMLARLREAWTHITTVPALRSLLLTQAVALVFFESAAPIELAYAKATLHAGDGGFGLLVTTWGAGVVVGSALFARARTDALVAFISGGTLAVGAAYLGFAAAPTLAIACLAAFVGGVGNGTQWAPLISAVQRLTPSELHGRVMGALESIGGLSPAIGLVLGGVLVALASPRTAFVVVGTGAALTTVAFARVRIVQTSAPADAALPADERDSPGAPRRGREQPCSDTPRRTRGGEEAAKHPRNEEQPAVHTTRR